MLATNTMVDKKAMAFDEVIAKIQAAGLEDDFIESLEKDPELMNVLNKISPKLSSAAKLGGWSCCVSA